MLKQGTFITKKYTTLLLGNLLGGLILGFSVMSDSIIGGNQLGEVSLQAVSIVYPLYSIIGFFSYLIAPGAAIIFGKKIGEFKEKEAHQVAGTSIIASLIVGIILAIALFIIKEPFLAYYECTGDLYREASAYYNWMMPIAVLYSLSIPLYYLVVADGEVALTSISITSNFVTNIVLSILLTKTMGISGLGFATCISLLLPILVYPIHFLKKSNNVKLKLCLKPKVIGKSIVLSASNYMFYLFLAVVDIVMNKVVITNCGVEYIPAYTVINLVFTVCEVYETFTMSSLGFVTCFLGEKNNHDLKIIFRNITNSCLIMSGALSLFFFFGAPLIPIIYGLETPSIISTAITTSRIMAFTTLGFGTAYLITSTSFCLEKSLQACFISLLNDCLSPLIMSVILGKIWGFTGITVGMALSPYVAIGVYALFHIRKKGFPLYVEDYGEEARSYDIEVTPNSIIELRNSVSKELTDREFYIKNIELLIEELFTRIREKNPEKKVIASCTLLFSRDQVRIIIRDNGVIFNFVDENNKIESVNAHVLNTLLEQTKEKNYVVTTSFNRNGFVFRKQ